jgi:hypothetical protein
VLFLSSARLGIDLFISNISLGIAGGATTAGVSIVAPRAGYFLELAKDLGLWIRGGVFFARDQARDYRDQHTEYFGIYGEGLLNWFPSDNLSLSVGPTLDFGFSKGSTPNFLSIGLLQFGLTAFL